MITGKLFYGSSTYEMTHDLDRVRTSGTPFELAESALDVAMRNAGNHPSMGESVHVSIYSCGGHAVWGNGWRIEVNTEAYQAQVQARISGATPGPTPEQFHELLAAILNGVQTVDFADYEALKHRQSKRIR